VKPWKTIDRAPTPEGELLLQERDGVFVVRVNGHELMSSARHHSEEAMADVGVQGLAAPAPRVLIGGLGLGYTLRRTLDLLPATAQVTVAEISQAVVTWNEGPLAPLAGSPLKDVRVVVERADVARVVASAHAAFDAILLDVDNGPEALSRAGNQHLYGKAGLGAVHRALRPRGRVVVWSAGPDARFLELLRAAGFVPRQERVEARRGSGTRHVLFVGERRE
jgi:spermidine synthase